MEKKEETIEERTKKLQKLRALCKAKREEMRIQRSSKKQKEAVLDQILKKIGIDKEKFKADLEAVRKQGGLEINMKH